MLKIVAAFDGLKFSLSTQQYAIYLAKKLDAFLTIVFLDDKTYTSYKIYDLVLADGVSESKLKQAQNEDQINRQYAAQQINKICIKEGIRFTIHHDQNYAINELLHESVFSDLLIINYNEKFSHHEEEFPSKFISNLLSESSCPILLVPNSFSPIDKNIFFYDGSPTSVYAIKMFAQLFPFFAQMPLDVVAINSSQNGNYLYDNLLIKELINRHFHYPTFTVLKGSPEIEAIDFLKIEKKNAMVILGSYGRTKLSRWFKSSFVEAIVKEFSIPIFLSHH